MSEKNLNPDENKTRDCDPHGEAVRRHMERILASPDFAQSARLKRFLRHIVEETLAGRSDRLSEYSVGVDVFDRDETFDPQTSSIVRVEASRLRAKLEKFDIAAGDKEACHILLPRGGYVPELKAVGGQSKTIEESEVRPGPSLWSFPGRYSSTALISVGVVIALLAVYLLSGSLIRQPDVEKPQAAVPSVSEQSIAVLPLRNLSGNSEEDYFSDGVTDALITSLAQLSNLRVISMTSSMIYKGSDRAIPEIARELNVDYIVEGSVLIAGERVRITAQLIEADADRHLWAESYERNISDVLALQGEVVRKIASSLALKVEPGKMQRGVMGSDVDPKAYEAYLRGNFFRRKMTEDGFKRGLEYFQEAIDIAPDYAPAHSGLATCYCLLGGHGFELINPHESMPTAKEAILEALELDDTLPEAHAFLGIIKLKYEWDWPEAEQSILRAIELDPNYAQARVFYSYYLEAMGRTEEAIAEARNAKNIDPLSLGTNVNLGWQLLKSGHLEEARQVFVDTAEIGPDFWGVHWGLGQYHLKLEKYDAAATEFQKAIAAGGGHAMPLSALGYTYAMSGQPEKANEMIDKLNALAEQNYVSPFNMAIIHAGLGEGDAAFAYLEEAYTHRSRSMAWLNVTEELDTLRGDPRFQDMLLRVGLTQ